MSNRLCIRILTCAILAATLGGGVSTQAGEFTLSVSDLRQGTELVQAGDRLILLGVTADNYALYQDGETVYASALTRGAKKHVVGMTSPGVVAFAYTVGKVAFVWTQPDRSIPGFGVSPLTVWSAATGAHKAADHSPIGTFTTSASADGRYVMFTSSNSQDGSVGNIEFARTDMIQRETLVANVPMAFPSGACRPWGSFVGDGFLSHPVALFCEGGASTATLASWSSLGRKRSTLLTGALTQPVFTASPDGRQFFTALAGSRTPVVVSDRGKVRRLEDGVLSRRGFFTTNFDVYYSALSNPANPGEIHRATLLGPVKTATVADNLFTFLSQQAGSDLIVTPPSSPDGRKVAYTTGFDPATGLSDIRLANLTSSGSKVLESTKNIALSGPVFSADSKYTLYAQVDLNTGNAQLVAAGPQGKSAIGTPSLWGHERLQGANIAYSDNTVFNQDDFYRSTADLKVVNLSRSPQSPSMIQAQAYLTFYPASHGRELVFTTGVGSRGPGLYVTTFGPNIAL